MAAMNTSSSVAATASIRAEAGRRNISQRELAERIDMSQAALSRRMVGAQAWDLDELDKIAGLFGMATRELLVDHPAVTATH